MNMITAGFNWKQIAVMAVTAAAVVYASNNSVPLLGRTIQRGLR